MTDDTSRSRLSGSSILPSTSSFLQDFAAKMLFEMLVPSIVYYVANGVCCERE